MTRSPRTGLLPITLAAVGTPAGKIADTQPSGGSCWNLDQIVDPKRFDFRSDSGASATFTEGVPVPLLPEHVIAAVTICQPALTVADKRYYPASLLTLTEATQEDADKADPRVAPAVGAFLVTHWLPNQDLAMATVLASLPLTAQALGAREQAGGVVDFTAPEEVVAWLTRPGAPDVTRAWSISVANPGDLTGALHGLAFAARVAVAAWWKPHALLLPVGNSEWVHLLATEEVAACMSASAGFETMFRLGTIEQAVNITQQQGLDTMAHRIRCAQFAAAKHAAMQAQAAADNAAGPLTDPESPLSPSQPAIPS